jgi:hypothetical protein
MTLSLRGSWDKEKIPTTLLSYVVEKGKFNMELAIKKFMQHYHELYNKSRESLLEEAETRNKERMDIIVDYGT